MVNYPKSQANSHPVYLWVTLPEFLSLRFLKTEIMTSRFPRTSTTVVKIKTLAKMPMTQAGRAVPSGARARSSCPSRGSVRFFMRVIASGIAAPSCFQVPAVLLSPAGDVGAGVS